MIAPDDKALSYSGRIDFEDPMAPEFINPCSSITARFTGTGIKALVSNRHGCWDNYLGAVIDGQEYKYLLENTGEKQYITLAEGLPEGEHDLLFFKRMDSCHMFRFYGFFLEEGGELLPAPPKPARRIEVYGDSVSAGEVSEALDYCKKADPVHQGQYSNSYWSYAWITARKLNAEIHDIAQGGISLLDGTGWFMAPAYRGIESTYGLMQYNKELGEDKAWDFSRYTPHVVIVAIGQNDNHPEDYMAEDYEGEKAINWRNHYRDFILRLRGHYPKALIVLATTILQHHPAWDRAISQVCMQLGDERVRHFLYTENGVGTPGHIRKPEAEKMARELSAYIESFGESIWE